MFDITHELRVTALPDAVFAAITTAAGLGSWLATDADAQAVADSSVSFTFDDGSGLVEMAVDLLEAPVLAHWQCVGGPNEWVGTSIAWRIEGVDADDDGTLDGVSIVRFWHGNWEYEDGLLPSTSFQWAMRLDSLRRYLESGTGSPA
jgi:hypothetical protein